MKLETQDGWILSETKTIYGQSKYIGLHALAFVANTLKSMGADDMAVSVQTELPAYAYKSKIHAVEKLIQEACKEQGVHLLETKSRKIAALKIPAVTVTGIAKVRLNDEENITPGKAGQEIVLTKWVGMDGMLQIVEEKEPELKERFAPGFLKQIKGYRQYIFALKEIQEARTLGVSAIRQIGDGGILATLWNLAKETQTGIALELKNLSILQETIEVCEHYRLNPYQLTSAGSLLMLADDGEALSEALKKEGIPACVIGRTTDNNDKVIYNGEEVRYIDRPAPDEIAKIFSDT